MRSVLPNRKNRVETCLECTDCPLAERMSTAIQWHLLHQSLLLLFKATIDTYDHTGQTTSILRHKRKGDFVQFTVQSNAKQNEEREKGKRKRGRER